MSADELFEMLLNYYFKCIYFCAASFKLLQHYNLTTFIEEEGLS